ncbi:MAG: hypothetical protein Q8R92_11955 [Deltaproteobacteria bacterium]|nr:hypothetical protein [Deltaproteobacteria bacterium]
MGSDPFILVPVKVRGSDPAILIRPGLLLLLLLLLPGCAQRLNYVAVASDDTVAAPGAPERLVGYVVTVEREKWAKPNIGSRAVHREVKKLPRPAFEKARAGIFEQTACWRFTTADATTWSAEHWTLEAALSDRLVLRERNTPASRVVDAQDLQWIESPREFPVQFREHTLRARRVTLEKRERVVQDYYGKVHRAPVGQVRYAPPRGAPPDVVFGVDRDGNAWPIDLPVIRGFIEMNDTSTIVLGSYRTVPLAEIRRWEFDREWGPWSVILAPYLGTRWMFTNKDYIARCEIFP